MVYLYHIIIREFPHSHKGNLLLFQEFNVFVVLISSGKNHSVHFPVLDQPLQWFGIVSVRRDHDNIIIIGLCHFFHAIHTGMEKRHIHKGIDLRQDNGDIIGLGLCQALCCRIGIKAMFFYVVENPVSGSGSNTAFSGDRPGNCAGRHPQFPRHIMDRHCLIIPRIIVHTFITPFRDLQSSDCRHTILPILCAIRFFRSFYCHFMRKRLFLFIVSSCDVAFNASFYTNCLLISIQ